MCLLCSLVPIHEAVVTSVAPRRVSGVLRAGAAAASLAFLPLNGLGGLLPAADDRDQVEQTQQAAAQHMDQVKHELEGIEASLAQVYVDLEQANQQIPVAQSQLEEAQKTYQSAHREHEIALGQLQGVQAESTRIREAIAEAEKQQKEASRALGGLARELYQGGQASPMIVALTAQGTQEIADRTAAADALARAQNSALASAVNVQATRRTQQGRQDAISARIAALEETARRSAQQAEEAQKTAQDKVAELDNLKKTSEAKKVEWDAHRAELENQLGEFQREYEAATAKLAEIDEENRRQNRRYTSASNFSNPLPVQLVMTSRFGWRHHPVLGIDLYHNGTDFAANCGTPIYPVAEGVVTAVTVERAGGNVVYVNHGMMNGASMSTAYVHMQKVDVRVGQQLTRDTVVGEVGATGYATGCHLHLSVMRNGVDVDPMDYL